MKHPFSWYRLTVGAALFAAMAMVSTLSQAQTTASKACLLEMFTSEFCGYCQQAEQWIAQNSSALKPKVVLLPQHVQSFDTAETKDPYASKKLTERHRSYRALGKSQFVATPQFFYNGQEIRNWKEALTKSCKSNTLYGLSLRSDWKVERSAARIQAVAELENMTGYQYNHKVYFALVEQTSTGKFIARHLSDPSDIRDAKSNLEPIRLPLQNNSSYNLVAFVQNIHTLEVFDVSFLNLGVLKASD